MGEAYERRLQAAQRADFLERLAELFTEYPDAGAMCSMDGMCVRFAGDSRSTVVLGYSAAQIANNAKLAAEDLRKQAA